ncbi:ribulose-phosphate 3-epimerase [Lactovum odontotermitis]
MTQILPSIFGANLLKLDDEIKFLEAEDTQILHVDVMDGNFVNNIAFGPNQIAALKKASRMTFDCHLMLADPERHLDDILAAGAEMISVHYEATAHIHAVIKRIKDAGRKAGVVINPATPESVLTYLLDEIDYVLVMTIDPGRPGAFIPKSLEKIANVKKMIAGRDILLEVDGGVNQENIKQCQAAGADLIVVGGAIFNGEAKANYDALKQKLTGGENE